MQVRTRLVAIGAICISRVAARGVDLLQYRRARAQWQPGSPVLLRNQGSEASRVGERLDDALLWPGLRLADLENPGFGTKRVTGKNGIWQPDVIRARGEPVFADIGNTRTGDYGRRHDAVHQRFPELGPRRMVRVEVDLVRIVAKRGKPEIVGVGHRAPDPCPVGVTDREVFEETSLPTLLYGDLPASW